MFRKSQISIFIIIALIILILFVFLVSQSIENKSQNINQDFQTNDFVAVKEYIEYCLKRQTDYAIFYTYLNNGIYQSGNARTNPQMPYLLIVDFYEEDHRRTSFNGYQAQQSIQLYLQDTLPYCIAQVIDDYNRYNITFVQAMNLDVEVKPENLKVNLNLPVVVSDITNTKNYEDFIYIIEDFPYERINNDVNAIIDSLLLDAQNINPQNDTVYNFTNYDTAIENILSDDNVDIYIFAEEFNQTDNLSSASMYFLEYGGKYKEVQVGFGVKYETREGITN